MSILQELFHSSTLVSQSIRAHIRCIPGQIAMVPLKSEEIVGARGLPEFWLHIGGLMDFGGLPYWWIID